MKNKIKSLFLRGLKLTYLKLFRANDSPHKIAFGFGLGVFLGILPGTGPIAALVTASLLKVNKAASVLGALLTNTWTSLITIILSIKIGSAIMGLQWTQVYGQWHELLSTFHWKLLFSFSFLKIALPVLLGYLIISLALGLTAYFTVLIILSGRKHEIKNKKTL